MTYRRAWIRARQDALTAAEQASPLARRPYDLRHACVSTWLNAGVPATQVAEWAGHSVEMLMRVLDDGMSTRLYERICDRLGLCYDVSGMFEAYEDDGVLDIAAGVQHERAIQVTREIFAGLRA